MSPHQQQSSLLARRLTLAMALPVALLVVLGAILGRQIVRMAGDARWVDHSDQVIGTASETLKQIIDQETGLRGYLVTEQPVFLEPVERAHPEDGFTRLHELVSDNPPQQQKFEEVRRRYADWLDFVTPALQGHNLAGARSVGAMLEHKRRMDGVREAMSAAVGIEDDLRRTRVADSASSRDTTRFLFVLLIAASAAILAFVSRRQLSSIASIFSTALEAETRARLAVETEAWVRSGQSRLVDALQGERTLQQLAEDSLAILAAYGHADVGAFFTREAGVWQRRGGYALDPGNAGPATFADGEGMVGQVARNGTLLHLRDVPPALLRLRGSIAEGSPVEVVVIPARIEGTTNAVLELGFLHRPDARTLEMLGRVSESIALAVRSSEYKSQLRQTLDETQRQAEELQTQQEELRVANEELETQTTALRRMHQELETQQAELEQTNDSLVQQSQLLERQNQQLAERQAEISAKAREVERASRFKSEFLSNMSHELRTPLNSSLIMAKLLADNAAGNLSGEQVRFAETIYSAGNDLLVLINDILDLSKIESGKMDVRPASVRLEHVPVSLMRTFEPVAREKKLRFAVNLAPSAPAVMETDAQRLEQILRNLISNAMKFTEAGEVVVDIDASEDRVTFAVRDTGIGIARAQQGIIFEAFRQADGTTNRKYGGTGLGLSISRELARLLGGDIAVRSEVGQGSTFTLSLPRVYTVVASPVAPVERAPTHLAATRHVASTHVVSTPPPPSLSAVDGAPESAEEGTEPGKRVVLAIEDDEAFARILVDVARDAGFHCLVASTAQQGLLLARKRLPTGIILDMKLPDHTGLTVLDRLKRDPATRHIPVHVVSASEYSTTALSMGAVAYLMKPVEREQLVEAFRALEARSSHRVRRVLVVEDDADLRDSVARLLGRVDVEIATAASVAEALALLREKTFDCIVTDLGFPERSGYELLESMASQEPSSVPPVIVYTGRALTAEEEQRLRKYSKSIIVKGARSPERLLDEVTLFLHQVESELPPDQRRLLKQARHREAVFEGRTILVVEDDVRNLFALTSLLEPKGAQVAIARNGKEALAALAREPRIDLVLMDLMMPEMDGLEATREIRKDPQWARLPIIALTAKAMRDDQERCLAAGANDYLAKPLDIEMLLSLLRVWMPKV
jgi:CheY-like chemotaxis protein/signal transduction histidine kinase/CHASE3 domain sensor protein